MSSYEAMEAYLRENFLIIDYCYVGPISSKSRDAFYPKNDVVPGQMLIVWSPEEYCAIWFGRVVGSVYLEPDVGIKFYKVEFH